MSGKKWCVFILTGYITVLVGIAAMVVIVDPYFHYHAPIEGFSYDVDNSEYVNDGITKHFEYDAMITGTSMTRGFRTAEAEELFNKKFVRITYAGEGFKKINDNLNVAITSNPSLNLVIRGLDPMWFITDENHMGYSEYPEYLYDNKIWNDVNYLYNKDILSKDVIPEVIRTIKGKSPNDFDGFVGNGKNASEKNNVLATYQRMPKYEKKIEQSETDEFFGMLERNLEKNVVTTIKENPDIEFYVFIPPYSICWWDGLNQYGVGVLTRRIDMEKYVIEKLLQYENVRLFSFFNNFNMVCDLDNYIDDVHYTEVVNSDILVWMKNGEYELTKENYMDYIDEITEFYSSYDYDSIFTK